MKSLLRITVRSAIVLAVAAAVASILWFAAPRAGWLVEGGPPANAAQMQAQPAADASGVQPAEQGGRGAAGGHADNNGASLAAFGGIVKNLLVISAIVAGVAALQWLYKRLLRSRRPKPAPALAP